MSRLSQLLEEVRTPERVETSLWDLSTPLRNCGVLLHNVVVRPLNEEAYLHLQIPFSLLGVPEAFSYSEKAFLTYIEHDKSPLISRIGFFRFLERWFLRKT